MSPPLARQPLPDALRALAMLAVLTVNAAGYLDAPWGALLGERTPPESGLALAVQGLVAALLQGKGYPMLAFLFGMGLFLAQRAPPAVPGLRSAPPRAVVRQKKLLKLGVLHGVFIYFGDILTMYALMGWQLLRHVREPWPALRRRLRRALGWTLGAALLSILLALLWAVPSTPTGDTAFEPDPTLSQTHQLLDFWLLNASAYVVMQIGALLLLCPLLRLCMLCGVAAARLRLLTHRRWRYSLWRWTRRSALPLALLHGGYGAAYVSVVEGSQRALWVELIGSLIGPPLSAVYVLALALAARGGHAAWCLWFAPLGRRTLSLYVGFNLLCAVLFTGWGLGLQPSTLLMTTFSMLVWCLALIAARASAGQRWPLERWMARR